MSATILAIVGTPIPLEYAGETPRRLSGGYLRTPGKEPEDKGEESQCI